MKKVIAILLSLAMILSFAACDTATAPAPDSESAADSSSATDAKNAEYIISVLGGTFGENLAFTLCVSEIITKYVDGAVASIVKSSGSEMNTIMASDMGPNEVVYHTTSMDFISSIKGMAPWEEAYPDQRLLTAYNPGVMTLLANKPDLTIYDMEGKTISVLPLPSLQMQFVENMLDLVGLKGKVNLVQLDFGACEDALRDGTVDALVVSIYNPEGHEKYSSSVDEVMYALKNKLYWVQIPEEICAKAAADQHAGFGCRKVETSETFMPLESRSTYGETCVFTNHSVLKDMDEDLAYAITKAICEHTDEFIEYDSGGEFVTPESIAQALAYVDEAYIHPGAIRYYKEAGLWPAYEAARAVFVETVGE